MIAVDSNILVYAHRVESRYHHAARNALSSLLADSAPWGIPWPCVHEFLATVTKSSLAQNPTPLATALAQMSALLGARNLTPLSEGPGFFQHLERVTLTTGSTGGAIHDARIAAICLSQGISELWTADRGFARFAGLSSRNPLPKFDV